MDCAVYPRFFSGESCDSLCNFVVTIPYLLRNRRGSKWINSINSGNLKSTQRNLQSRRNKTGFVEMAQDDWEKKKKENGGIRSPSKSIPGTIKRFKRVEFLPVASIEAAFQKRLIEKRWNEMRAVSFSVRGIR